MSKLLDRVQDTSVTTGTGSYALSGVAPMGYQAFSTVGNGKTCPYIARCGASWETGIGTYSSTGPTLARTKVLHSSNGDAAVDWPGGTITISLDAISEYLVVDPGIARGRLTTSSTLSVTPPTQAASATLYYLPHEGNKVALYDGTGWRLHTIPDAGFSLTVGGVLTADQNYDIWLWDNDGTPELEALAWSSHGAGTGARGTALVRQDGVWSKTGALTRRYLGSIRTVSSSGTKVRDALGFRYVWNVQNRVPVMDFDFETTDSWSVSASEAATNATTTLPWRHQFILGLPSSVKGRTSATARGAPSFAIALNSTSRSTKTTIGYHDMQTGVHINLTSQFEDFISEGYGYLQGTESSPATSVALGDQGAGTYVTAGMAYEGER